MNGMWLHFCLKFYIKATPKACTYLSVFSRIPKRSEFSLQIILAIRSETIMEWVDQQISSDSRHWFRFENKYSFNSIQMMLYLKSMIIKIRCSEIESHSTKDLCITFHCFNGRKFIPQIVQIVERKIKSTEARRSLYFSIFFVRYTQWTWMLTETITMLLHNKVNECIE